MKIFAIYLRINLTQKPKWFDKFRKKNEGWFELHITLIQPRYITDEQIKDLKSRVKNTLAELELEEKDKKLIFNKPVFEELPDGKYLFMWLIEKNLWLMQLQKKLRAVLENYDNYCDEITKEYEEDFRPHITVVESIDANQKKEVERSFSSDFMFEGTVKDLVLPVVKNTSKEERENANNLTIFDLY